MPEKQARELTQIAEAEISQLVEESRTKKESVQAVGAEVSADAGEVKVEEEADGRVKLQEDASQKELEDSAAIEAAIHSKGMNSTSRVPSQLQKEFLVREADEKAVAAAAAVENDNAAGAVAGLTASEVDDSVQAEEAMAEEREVFDEIDTNHDGVVDTDEFAHYVNSHDSTHGETGGGGDTHGLGGGGVATLVRGSGEILCREGTHTLTWHIYVCACVYALVCACVCVCTI